MTSSTVEIVSVSFCPSKSCESYVNHFPVHVCPASTHDLSFKDVLRLLESRVHSATFTCFNDWFGETGFDVLSRDDRR